MLRLVNWLLDRGWPPEAVAWVTAAPMIAGGGLIGFVLGRLLG